jgi:hypothetical protein
MIRRSFLTRTLGAIAGAVCAPFVGKAADPVLCDPDYISFADIDAGNVGITMADIHEISDAYFSSLKRPRALTGPACSAADYMAADPGAT